MKKRETEREREWRRGSRHASSCGGVASPVGAEDVEGRGLVAAVVHLHHWVGDRRPRHHLLVLDGTALEGLPHVDVLQGDWGRGGGGAASFLLIDLLHHVT